ncbi:anthranilate phosphoribosyltransferase, TrpD [Amanita muscaria]
MSQSVTFTHATFQPLLKRLVETPESFTPDDLKSALYHLLTPNVVQPAQIGAFLAALRIHRLERRSEFLVAAASALRARAVKAEIQDRETDFVVDIVGTGGDGHNLFNVSTTAAIVAAGAGARVVKHGNRASTSSSGSADLLESLGCSFTAPSAASVHIPAIPFTFMLAPLYHPALATVSPYRKALPFRTMFNLIGPLISPADPRGMVLGVASPEMGPTFARSLLERGVDRALVVCGYEKLDEISCAGPTWVWEVHNGSIEEKTIRPEDFGLPVHPLTSVAGGSAAENADLFKELLAPGSEFSNRLTPFFHFVLLNTSALLVIAGIARDFVHGVELGRESVTSGRAWAAFEQYRDLSRSTMEN